MKGADLIKDQDYAVSTGWSGRIRKDTYLGEVQSFAGSHPLYRFASGWFGGRDVVEPWDTHEAKAAQRGREIQERLARTNEANDQRRHLLIEVLDASIGVLDDGALDSLRWHANTAHPSLTVTLSVEALHALVVGRAA